MGLGRGRGPVAPSRADGGGQVELVVRAVAVVALTVHVVTLAAQAAPADSYLAPAAAAVGIAMDRHRPIAALVLLAAAPLVCTAVADNPLALWNVAVFETFVLTVRGLPALPAGAVSAAATYIAASTWAGTVALSEPTASIGAFSCALAASLGAAVLSQRRYRYMLEARALDAEATRQAAIDRGVTAERVRIARDLHDGVGHHVAVVSMHLGAAQANLPSTADTAQAALHAARESVQAVLAETQQILTVLRDPETPAHTSEPAAPPDHRSIPHLADAARAAGLTLTATYVGLDRDLPPQTSAAAYRIVQETITNAHRHGTGDVALRVECGDRTVLIEVSNDCATELEPPPASGGLGIVGMTERATSAGGHLRTGNHQGRFEVCAELPIHRRPR